MLITILKAILLGIIEGLTEFLPVSSTGHLIIANKYLNFTGEFANSFAVIIQVGAIFAVVLYFKDKVFPPLKGKKEMIEYISLWTKVAVGVLPAVIVALLFEDYIDAHFFNAKTVAIALIVGAGMLFMADSNKLKATVHNEKYMTYKQALIIGIFQCLAIILPGMSRSASTITGGLFMGLSRTVAAEFSFFMAIPALVGAAGYKMVKIGLAYTTFEWVLLGIGTFVSFIVAYFVIAKFMDYIKTKKLAPFAYYRIALGILVLLFA